MNKISLSLLQISFLIFSSSISAATLPDIPQVAQSTPIDVKSRNFSKTIEFRKLSTSLTTADGIGKTASGLFCSSESAMFYKPGYTNSIANILSKVFKEETVKYGYPDYAPGESLFEDKVGGEADFLAGATLQDLKYSVCWADSQTYKGKAYVKLKWEIFSNQLQKVVYSKVLESSIDTSSEKPFHDIEFDKRLYSTAVDTLLADTKFVNIFQSSPTSLVASEELPPISIRSSAKAPGTVSGSNKELSNSVVTVESGIMSGTGFFISEDGYLLTNQTNVGNAKFVKVIPASGPSLVGEVIRINSARNVALLKTESKPSSMLALRTTPIQVGEEVYSIGSPLGKTFAGSFSRGIISAKRTDNGISYLQSDVAVASASAGGPLVDKSGAVIGMSQLTFYVNGINFFMPIDDALEKLAITIEQRAQATKK